MANPILAGDVQRLSTVTVTGTDLVPVVDVSEGVIGKVTVNNLVAGADAVDGPASSTDNAIARFDGTDGKLLQNSATTVNDTTGTITFNVAAGGVTLKQGANGRVGTTVLTAGASTVSNTSVAITDTITLSLNTVGGTIAAQPWVDTITAGVGFTVAGGGASNTSTYNYSITKNAA